MIHYKTITFEQALPVWRDRLWVGRESPIEPCSSMRFMGTCKKHKYDLSYMNASPYFIGAFDNATLIGVNSGHLTGKGFRSRGLWVDEGYRRQGISQQLLRSTIAYARIMHQPDYIWSIPRESVLLVYERAGFTKCSDFFDYGMEFGPNCYVTLKLGV